jgi:hypothetical protein
MNPRKPLNRIRPCYRYPFAGFAVPLLSNSDDADAFGNAPSYCDSGRIEALHSTSRLWCRWDPAIDHSMTLIEVDWALSYNPAVQHMPLQKSLREIPQK